VDFVGLDGYNWGTESGNVWQSAESVFAESYALLTTLTSKPVIITETASGEAGGDKAAWIKNTFMSTIPRQFPRVSAVIWFNKVQEEDWRVNSSEASLAAYRAVVNCSLYGGSGPCEAGSTGRSSGHSKGKTRPRVRAVRVTKRVSSRMRGHVSYGLTDAARVRISVVPLTGSGPEAVISRAGRRGPNRVSLRRILRPRRLHRGRYRVVVVARDGSGHTSRPRKTRFRVL
ncbi:MAG: hypothetical protein ACM3NV_00690, partial [Syntrophothermus sp.]